MEYRGNTAYVFIGDLNQYCAQIFVRELPDNPENRGANRASWEEAQRFACAGYAGLDACTRR